MAISSSTGLSGGTGISPNSGIYQPTGLTKTYSSTPAPSPFDPNTLAWVAGRRKNWWHNNGSAGSLTIGANGTGGVPIVTDPVGCILSGASTDGYNLNYGNAHGILRADGVEIASTTYFIKSLAGTGNIRDTGFTCGVRVRLNTGSLMVSQNSFGGTDINPQIDTMILNNATPALGLVTYLDSGGGYVGDVGPATADYSTFHTLLTSVIPNSGTTMDVIVRFDGATIATGQLQSNNAWDRDLPYFLGAGMTIMSRIFAQQGFSDTADLVNLENFLEYGA